MDGSSISLVVNGFTDLAYFVLDRQHARIYWEYDDKFGLYVFDIVDGHGPRIVPLFSSGDFLEHKILLYVSGDVFFWQVTPSEDTLEIILSDATKEVGNFSALYQASVKIRYKSCRQKLPPLKTAGAQIHV